MNRFGLAGRLACAWAAAVSLWIALGVQGFNGDDSLRRLALLPPVWELAAALAAASVFVAVMRPSRSFCLGLLSFTVLLLPWIPAAHVPASFLIWTDRAALAAIAAIAVGLLATHWHPVRPRRLMRACMNPQSAPWAATAIAAVLMVVAAARMAPILPTGDEPEYLVITQSLLLDRDLQTTNNYERKDYRDYVPAASHSMGDYLHPGVNGRLYSIHMPALPLFVAPAFAVAGYAGVNVFLALLSAAAGGLAWKAAYSQTRDVAAAWVGWAVVSLSAPFFLFGFVVYPDVPAAAVVMLLVWTFCRADPPRRVPHLVLIGSSLALLPWLQQRLAALALTLAVLLLLRMRSARVPGRAYAFLLVVPVAGAAAWFGYFYTIYGNLSPWTPYGTAIHELQSARYIPHGLLAILFDQQFGLLPNAPVFLVPLAACVWLAATPRDPGEVPAPLRRLSIELAVMVGVSLLTASAWLQWWSASGVAAARYVVPVHLPLAIPAAVAWSRARTRTARYAYAGALIVSLVMTAILVVVGHGDLAHNNRLEPWQLMLDWLTPVVDLPMAFPSFLRDTTWLASLKTATFLVCVSAAWLALRRLDRRWSVSAGGLVLAATAFSATGLMAAAQTNWMLSGSPGITVASSATALLSAFDRREWASGVRFERLRAMPAESIVSELRIGREARHPFKRPGIVMLLPHVPAGTYRLTMTTTPQSAAGRLTLAIGPGWWPIASFTTEASPKVLDFHLPVAVSSIGVLGDSAAVRGVGDLTLRPMDMASEEERLTEAAPVKAMGYGALTAYFLDEFSYPEPGGFWIAPGEPTQLAVNVAPGARAVRVRLTNVPASNSITLRAARWETTVTLAAEEERLITVPLNPAETGTLLTLQATAGVRPADLEGNSGDARQLGAWVQLD